MILNCLIASFVIALVEVFILYCILTTISAAVDLELKDWLTLWPYKHWFLEFRDIFDFKLLSIGVIIFAVLNFCNIWSSVLEKNSKKQNGELAEASHVECVCSCAACKETAELVKTLAAKLDIDLKASSSTNIVARPSGK